MFHQLATVFVIAVFSLTLVGCGSEGTSAPGPELVMTTSSPKQLTFLWDSWFGTSLYDVQCSEDGTERMADYADAINCTGNTETVDIPVHLTNWGTCQFSVVAHNEANNLRLSYQPVTLAQNLSPGAIGYFKASNTNANDEFGSSLAISGDGNTIAVGAYAEKSSAPGVNADESLNDGTAVGAVYIFVFTDGFWSQQAYIKSSNAASNDWFGRSIALSSDGNTLAVGADGEDSNATTIDGDETDNSSSHAGAVYIFTRSGTTWTQQAYVKASNTDAEDYFGTSVSLNADGNTLAVGSKGEASASQAVNVGLADNSAANTGAAYVYTRSGTTWSQQAYIKAADTGTVNSLGISVSLDSSGNTLAVGSSYSAYIFARSGAAWSQEAAVKAANAETDDLFGYTVAISGDGNTLAVGAFSEDSAATGVDGDESDNSSNNSGAAYVFTRSGTNWSQQAYLKASNTHSPAMFGYRLSINADGTILAVGSHGERCNSVGVNGDQTDRSASYTGAVYVFTRSQDTWSQKSYVKASNAEAADAFGTSLSISADGTSLVVGANYEGSSATGVDGDQTNNGASHAGAVYLY